MNEIIPQETVEQKIFLIRNHKVMIDRDLAELYGVETKYLNRQVKRNIGRFPAEFMFQLTANERNELVTICHRFETMKHSRSMPYAFTEHGVAMLASVLKSERAVKISINIIKAFIKLREILSTHRELSRKLDQLERKIERHDKEIHVIFEAIRRLMSPSQSKSGKIGFYREKE
jgi:phage regulator Rha-like protein